LVVDKLIFLGAIFDVILTLTKSAVLR